LSTDRRNLRAKYLLLGRTLACATCRSRRRSRVSSSKVTQVSCRSASVNPKDNNNASVMRPEGCLRSDMICESEPLSIFSNIANARSENSEFLRCRLSSSAFRISAIVDDDLCLAQPRRDKNCGKICAGSPGHSKCPASSSFKRSRLRWIGHKLPGNACSYARTDIKNAVGP
jgi:hypothetical protein